MIALCTKDDLADGVNKVQKAVSTRHTLPVLQGIKIRAEGEALLFEATDLELGIRCRVPVNVLREGVIVIPAGLLNELTRRLPDGAVRLESEDNTLHIYYGESTFQINGFDPEEFPEFGSMELPDKFTIAGDQLRQMIRQTIFARTMAEDSKLVFSGLLLEKNEANIRLVGTDTHRLAYIFLPLQGEGSDFKGVIPGKAMAEIQRLLEDVPVEVFFDRSRMIFKFNNVVVMTRLIEGQYPNYENVIPSACAIKLRIRARELENVVERAALLSRDNQSKIAAVRFQISDNMLVIEQNNENGHILEKIAVDQVGEDLEVAFNARYLLDMIKVMETEFLIMEANGSFSAVIFRPDEVDNYVSLILPMRF
jgi:DNA polymerase-3 subunit beta